MKIPKAIEILSDSIADNTLLITLKHHEAIKLGIEALKKLKECQAHHCTLSSISLPGEPEE